VEDCREIASEDFIGRDNASAAECLDRHLGAMPSGFVHPGDAALRDDHGSDLVQQAHPFHDCAASAAKINSLPALGRGRCPLDDGDGVTRFA
jgi:hypothetical protein